MTTHEMLPEPLGRQQNIISARNYFADITQNLKECDVESISRGIIWLTQIAVEENDTSLFEEWCEKSEMLAVSAQRLTPIIRFEMNACLAEVYFNGLRLGDELSQQKLFTLLEKQEGGALRAVVSACQKWDISPGSWIETFVEEPSAKVQAWDYYYHLHREHNIPYDQAEAATRFHALAELLLQSDMEGDEAIALATTILEYSTDPDLRHELVNNCRELIPDMSLSMESYDELLEFALAVYGDRALGTLHEDWLQREEELMREDLRERQDIVVSLDRRAQFALAHKQCNGLDAQSLVEVINDFTLLEENDNTALYLRDSLLLAAGLRYQRYGAPDDAVRLVSMLHDESCWAFALQHLIEDGCEVSLAQPDILDPLRVELFEIITSTGQPDDIVLPQRLFSLIYRAIDDKLAFDLFMTGVNALQHVDHGQAVALTQELCNAAQYEDKSELEERLYVLLGKWRVKGAMEEYQHFIETYVKDIDRPLTFERYAQLALLAR